MAQSTRMNAYLKLLLVMYCSITTTSASIRADLQRGFKLCPGNQLGHVLSVEADGPGCRRRNGQPQWPCFIRAGRDGVFSISFVHYQPSEFITIVSSIHSIVTLSDFLNIKKRVGLPGEVNEYACEHTQPGCPIQPGVMHSIQKRVNVPSSVMFMKQNMDVEFKLTDKNGENIICFIAPIINI